jgi:hypothetical protein
LKDKVEIGSLNACIKKALRGGGLGLLCVRAPDFYVLRQAQKTILPDWVGGWDDGREVTLSSNLLFAYWAGLYHACLELSRKLLRTGALKSCWESGEKMSLPVKIEVSETEIETGGSNGV